MKINTKVAHNLKISVFLKEKDDEEEIKISLLSLLPFEEEELVKEKILIEEEVAELNYDREMKIYSIYVKRQRVINQILEHVLELLGEDQKKVLIETIDTRVDEKADFYFRLDKGKLNSGECELTDSGSCFHFRLNVAAYPSRKDAAIKILLENVLN